MNWWKHIRPQCESKSKIYVCLHRKTLVKCIKNLFSFLAMKNSFEKKEIWEILFKNGQVHSNSRILERKIDERSFWSTF